MKKLTLLFLFLGVFFALPTFAQAYTYERTPAGSGTYESMYVSLTNINLCYDFGGCDPAWDKCLLQAYQYTGDIRENTAESEEVATTTTEIDYTIIRHDFYNYLALVCYDSAEGWSHRTEKTLECSGGFPDCELGLPIFTIEQTPPKTAAFQIATTTSPKFLGYITAQVANAGTLNVIVFCGAIGTFFFVAKKTAELMSIKRKAKRSKK